jgi:ribonuclease HI
MLVTSQVKGVIMIVTIYTDGSCLGNPGPGGWGAVIQFSDLNFNHAFYSIISNAYEISGSENDTTNNRMEMSAVIFGLEFIQTHLNDSQNQLQVKLFTDSTYVKNGIELWCNKWQLNGWQTSDKKPVKNSDLWRQIIILNTQLRVQWNWVKGHSTSILNARADTLATSAADKIRR